MAWDIKTTIDKTLPVAAALSTLASVRVMVGVPAEKALRKPDPGEKGEPINNAALAYIHENGAPEAHIPPRPFLLPGVRNVQDEIERGVKNAGQLALDGNSEGMMRQLTAVGLKAQAAVRNKITDGPFVPLAQRTIEERAARGRKGAIKQLAQMAKGLPFDPNLTRPLIDTGQLRASINFVIRKTKG